jgi:hypothetical protein
MIRSIQPSEVRTIQGPGQRVDGDSKASAHVHAIGHGSASTRTAVVIGNSFFSTGGAYALPMQCVHTVPRNITYAKSHQSS